MLRNILACAAASLLALTPQPAVAQRLILPGALLLAGYRATCGPVDTMIQPINDIAAAYKGRIILHPRVLDLPRAQQLFWYTHECAHQIFGPGEAAADCWAVQQGKIQGWLSREELTKLADSMQQFPGDDTHASGGERISYMEKCFRN
ncbi:hypothetical protein EQZ23_05300 [Sphingomonas sp. UV9]|uniref:hypothetical protein n=1 Tax=Sphingomonas sp. UV9 TaxID=1851410 RepID=UPI000FFBC6FE|nr:hypothetical protein [Sphingomonas sp. UV9]RXD07448.1 hypothetical protein EQZ23_05300 [Sphingomonas sp. UV9]